MLINSRKIVTLILPLLPLFTMLSGCGVKPSDLKRPDRALQITLLGAVINTAINTAGHTATLIHEREMQRIAKSKYEIMIHVKYGEKKYLVYINCKEITADKILKNRHNQVITKLDKFSQKLISDFSVEQAIPLCVQKSAKV
jgi:hypothetical protein